MKLTELFLDQLERETEPTRRELERVPEGRNDWKPHAKSMDLGYLAAHIATLPIWITLTIDSDQLEWQSPESKQFIPRAVNTTSALVELLNNSVAAARAALEKTTDDHLMQPWRFLVGGKVVSESPRYAMIRDSIFGHLAHHRAQLGVYLRLNDIALPGIYGPSADEKFF